MALLWGQLIGFVFSVTVFTVVFNITLYIQASAGKQTFHREYGTTGIMYFTLHGVWLELNDSVQQSKWFENSLMH